MAMKKIRIWGLPILILHFLLLSLALVAAKTPDPKKIKSDVQKNTREKPKEDSSLKAKFESLPKPDQMMAIIKTKIEKKEPITLNDFPGLLDAISLPNEMTKEIASISIQVKKYGKVGNVFDFLGTINIKGFNIDISLHQAPKPDGTVFSIITPKGLDYKKIFPFLGPVAEVMTKLDLGRVYLISSAINYKHPELEIDIFPGFNLGAVVELTGILKDCQTLIDILKKADFLVVDRVAAIFSAFIPKGQPTNAELGVILPIRIGIDFTKKPFNIKHPYIRRIYSANIEALMALTGRVTFGGGIFLELSSQKEPLEFRSEIQLDPKGGVISIAAFMDGLYQPAFGLNWLGLGPLIGLEVGVSATPPWLNNIAMAGGFSLGKVVQSASCLVAFDIIEGNVLVDSSLKKLDLDELVKLTLLIAAEGKKEKEINKIKKAIPDLELEDVAIKVVPMEAKVFNRYYTRGIFGTGKIHIGPFKGGATVNISVPKNEDKKKELASLEAFLDPLKVKAGKLTIFELSGADEKTPLSFKVKLGFPSLGAQLSGRLEIPPIKFKSSTEIYFKNGKFELESRTNLGHDIFQGKAIISFDPKKPQDFLVSMSMDQKFLDHIKGKAGHVLRDIAGALIEIKSASFETSGQELAKGKLPEVKLHIHMFKQDLTLKVQADVSHVDDFFEEVAKKIKDLALDVGKEIKEAFEDVGEGVEKTAKKAVHETKDVAKKAEKKIEKAAKKTGKKIKDTAKKAAKKTKKFFKDLF